MSLFSRFLLFLILCNLAGCGERLELKNPNQVCAGPDGFIYVVNLGRGNILKYDPATWEITGAVGRGFLEKSYTLDVDPGGRILTANIAEGEISLDDRIFTSVAMLFNPAGDLQCSFGADTARPTPDQKSLVGSTEEIPASRQLLYVLAGCFTGDGGVVLSDAGRNELAVYGPDLVLRNRINGPPPEGRTGGGYFFYCTDIRRDPSGRFWTVDSYASLVRVFSHSFEPLGQYPQAPDKNLLYFPQSVAFSSDGRAFLTDTGNGRIVVLNPDFSLAMILPMPESLGSAPFLITGVAIFGEKLIISDSTNSRLIILGFDGTLIKIVGESK